MKDFSAVPGFQAELVKRRGSEPIWIFQLQPPALTNCAAASNGGTAAASSSYTGLPAANAINGDRSGVGYWNDNTSGSFPDTVTITFSKVQIISAINVFSVQDTYVSPSEPTSSMTFSLFGVTSFDLSYWSEPLSSWVLIQSITGNNLVWRNVSFAPVTTTQIMINITEALGGYARLAEIEVWTSPAFDSKYISDIPATISGWQASPIATLPWVATWGQITEQVSGSLNEIRIADFSLSLIADPDDADNINNLAATHNLEASPCSLFLWFMGLNAATDPPQEFYRGYIRDLATSDGGMTWQLTLEDESARLSGNYGEVLTQEKYPNALPAHVGRFLPIVFGTAKNIMPPIAKAFGGINYYLFGCPLSSIGTVVYADGTVPAGLSSSLANSSFGGNATIQCAATTANAVMGTANATYRADATARIYNGTYTGAWAQVDSCVDASDTTFSWMTTTLGTMTFTYAFPPGATSAKVRIKVYSTVNFSLYTEINGTPHTYNSGAVANGTVIDTGYYTSTAIIAMRMTVIIPSAPSGSYFYIYATWADYIYPVQTGTTYAPQPTDIICLTATRDVTSTPSIVTLVPVTVANMAAANVANEASARDGNPDTYATLTSNGANYCLITYSIPWDTRLLIPLKFRACATITSAGVTSGVLQAVWIGDTSTAAPVIHPPANASSATFQSGWATPPAGYQSSITLYVGFTNTNTTMHIHEAWVEVMRVDSLNAPDDFSTLLLGSTVNGTWSALPASYQANGAITESKQVIDHLDYLAFQFRCWFRISCGVARMIWRPDVLIPDPTVRPGTVIPWSTIAAVRAESGRPMWNRKRALKTDVVNAITLRYGRDYSLTGDSAYSKIASATDANSISDFGKLSRDELFKFDFCSQDQHAQSVRDFYLGELKNRYWLEELSVYLDQIALEFGDVVTLPDGRIGTVVSVGIQPGSIDQMDRINVTVMV